VRRLRLERPTFLVSLLFVLWAVAPLVVLLIRAATEGGTFGGADSALSVGDQYRFLAWIRDAGDHVLISDSYAPGPEEHVYLNPLFLLSGQIWKLGLSLQFAYLVWKPVALGMLLVGFVAYIARRLAGGPWGRAAALALALFFFTPVLPLLDWGGLASEDAANDMVLAAGAVAPFWQTWGYLAATIGIGLMPLYVLGVERVANRAPGEAIGAVASGTALAGLAVAWLHPWGGLTLLILTSAFLIWARRPPSLPILGVFGAVAAPLVYYWLLGESDPAWELGRLQTGLERPLWAEGVALAPLVLFAVLGVGRTRGDAGERLLLLWPPAALATYFLLDPSGRLPALAGMTLPLAILAVRGWERSRTPLPVGAAVLAALTLPGMLYAAQTFRDNVRGGAAPYTITDEENAALHYVADDLQPRVVLATPYLGATVPAFTPWRVRIDTEDLIGRVRSGVVLTDCRYPDHSGQLRALGYTARHFGCTTVFRHHP
jgi:hypothetical protein